MSIAEAPRLGRAPALLERAKEVAAAGAYVALGLPVALAELLRPGR